MRYNSLMETSFSSTSGRIELPESFSPQLFGCFSIALREDWFGRTIEKPLRFLLHCDSDSLLFSVVIPAAFLLSLQTLTPKPAAGEYVEGLWNADVVELFVFDSETPCYQEFHIGPEASWWAMGFRDYRSRDPRFTKPKGIETFEEKTAEATKLAMRLPLRLFSGRKAPSLLNVTAILGGQYFTWAEHEPGEPDFHRPRRSVKFSD